VHFFYKPRERAQPKPQPPTPVPRKMVSGIDADLQEVRDCIRSAEQAMRNRSKGASLLRHWKAMLGLYRNRERDLIAIRSEWAKRAAG
jgi:hypothetical protein